MCIYVYILLYIVPYKYWKNSLGYFIGNSSARTHFELPDLSLS